MSRICHTGSFANRSTQVLGKRTDDRLLPIGDEEGKAKQYLTYLYSIKYKEKLEARAGIEPAHKGFADLSLTTWVPRPGKAA